jgi:hypothetical protein
MLFLVSKDEWGEEVIILFVDSLTWDHRDEIHELWCEIIRISNEQFCGLEDWFLNVGIRCQQIDLFNIVVSCRGGAAKTSVDSRINIEKGFTHISPRYGI